MTKSRSAGGDIVKISVWMDARDKEHLERDRGGIAAGLEALLSAPDLDLSSLALRRMPKRTREDPPRVKITHYLQRALMDRLREAGGLSASINAVVRADRVMAENREFERAERARTHR